MCASASTETNTSAAKVQQPESKEKLLQASYGQPTHATHPHLINEGDLVPGQSVQEFQDRRQRLMMGIQKYGCEQAGKNGVLAPNGNHLLVVPAATKKYMSDKIPYVFRQNSDFMYLTGCLEPDSVLLLNIDTQGNVQSTLFMRPKDKHAELWDGPRTGYDNAPLMFGVDEAYAIDKFPVELQRRVLSEKPRMWFDAGSSELEKVNDALHVVANNTLETSALESATNFIHGMRLFKSPAEQDLMRHTCQIASAAINETISESRPGTSEHHIYAMLDYKCRTRNASYLAYPPVVASGQNATVIHYINNTQLTRSGDMVLVDAGCEYGGYTSDITRTWPIDGTFTAAQRVLYDIVLLVQKELIGTLLKEGGDTLDNLFETMCIKLGKYLQEAGLVPKDINDPVGYAKAGFKFCPHHVSHYLGMDVHDTPLMPRNLRLLPGMVCTVEPGIYIDKERMDVPPEFRGLGLRIEDDVLITKDNKVEVLTASCIKERSAIENISKEKFK